MNHHHQCGRIALLLGALLLALLSPGTGSGVAQGLEVGEQAPDFSLPSTAGHAISLGQFRGKKIVLLEFYGADFSPV